MWTNNWQVNSKIAQINFDHGTGLYVDKEQIDLCRTRGTIILW